jgi:predicted MPP superfamily phosphohydrolase
MAYWIFVIATYILAENVAFAALQIWLLRQRQPWPRGVGIGVAAWCFLMCFLFLLSIFEPSGWKPFMRDYLYFPMSVEMVWNLLILQALFPLTLLLVIVVRLSRRKVQAEALDEAGITRRKFLYLTACGAVPATAIAMGVHGTLTRTDLRVRKFDLAIRHLPPELEGFTIAHVSDLHSGVFVGPQRLRIVSDAVNDLKADLVALTGDLINRNMLEFPDALASIQSMRSTFGTFLCEGNHDTIPGGRLVVSACQAAGLPMIYNACLALPVRGQRLLLGGVAWDTIYYYDREPQLVSSLFPARQAGDVRILLAHHPHLFDIAQEADLVLSGHTHGGQIMLSPDVGLGRIRFKYCSGRYQRDNTTLIVSNGAGDWFPCRIGAPAEVGLLKLTAAG